MFCYPKKKKKEQQLICGCKEWEKVFVLFCFGFLADIEIVTPFSTAISFLFCLTTRYFLMLFFLFDILYLSIFPIFLLFIYLFFVCFKLHLPHSWAASKMMSFLKKKNNVVCDLSLIKLHFNKHLKVVFFKCLYFY